MIAVRLIYIQLEYLHSPSSYHVYINVHTDLYPYRNLVDDPLKSGFKSGLAGITLLLPRPTGTSTLRQPEVEAHTVYQWQHYYMFHSGSRSPRTHSSDVISRPDRPSTAPSYLGRTLLRGMYCKVTSPE
jgi:hypothetical protein